LGTNYDYVSQGLLLVYLNKVNTIYNPTIGTDACQKILTEISSSKFKLI
jgi:hypothetical protein